MKRPNVFVRALNWLRRNDELAALQDDVLYWKRFFNDACEHGRKESARARSLEETNAALRARLDSEKELASRRALSERSIVAQFEERLSDANKVLLAMQQDLSAEYVRRVEAERVRESQHQRIVQLDRLYTDVSSANEGLAQRIHTQARKLGRYRKRLQEFHDAKRATSTDELHW